MNSKNKNWSFSFNWKKILPLFEGAFCGKGKLLKTHITTKAQLIKTSDGRFVEFTIQHKKPKNSTYEEVVTIGADTTPFTSKWSFHEGYLIEFDTFTIKPRIPVLIKWLLKNFINQIKHKFTLLIF